MKTLEVKLMQHTPMIYFQYSENGATIVYPFFCTAKVTLCFHINPPV